MPYLTQDEYGQRLQDAQAQFGSQPGYDPSMVYNSLKSQGYTIQNDPADSFAVRHPILSAIGSGVNDLINAPGDLVTGLAEKAVAGIGAAHPKGGAFSDWMQSQGQKQPAQEISKNAGNTADIAANAAAFALTGGASIPVQMSIMGAGGAGGEALKQGIHDIAGDNKTPLPEQALQVGLRGAENSLLPLAGPVMDLAAPITKPITGPISDAIGDAVEKVGLKPAVDFLKQGILPPPEKEAEDAFTRSVMPSNTAKDFQNADPQLRIKGGAFSAASRNPTVGEKGLGKIAQSLEPNGFSPSASPIENAKVVDNAWDSEADALRKSMSANERLQGVKLSDDEIRSAVVSGIKKAGLNPDTGPGAKIMNAWEDSINGVNGRGDELPHGGTNGRPTGGWQAKINFSKEATRQWGDAIYDKGTDLADGVNSTHAAVDKLLTEKTAGMGVDYKGPMVRLAKMQDILGNLNGQLKGEVLKSGVGSLLSHPAAKVVGAALGGAGVISAGKETLNLLK